MSMIVFKNLSASGFFRWNEFRPMIEPNPPPSRMARTCSKTASSVSAAPPEKITRRGELERIRIDDVDPRGQQLSKWMAGVEDGVRLDGIVVPGQQDDGAAPAGA